MRNILQELLKLLKHITHTKKSDEKLNDFIKCLRQEAAKWAYVLNDSNCISTAFSKLTRHLDGTERLSEWKKWVYCNDLVNNETLWWDVYDEYLSCSTFPTITIDYSNMLIRKLENCDLNKPDYKNVILHCNDLVNSFLLTIAKHAKDNKVLEHILNNFDKIILR
ncbi:Aminopeptidase N [Temnothorax longispinosus]|uniref:Aminopeptidase N n=1 Tax=Temnothorax longispinosus TaxID=300112 RepID=A0A4S2KRC7_9HYME|nr:Aminopeptidase N [Temnothorax longispinosus]